MQGFLCRRAVLGLGFAGLDVESGCEVRFASCCGIPVTPNTAWSMQCLGFRAQCLGFRVDGPKRLALYFCNH